MPQSRSESRSGGPLILYERYPNHLTPLLLELLDHSIQIRIPRAKFAREPIPAALGNLLAVRNHLELTSLPRRKDGVNPQALLDEGHETRDLDLVVLSGGAVHDFHFHAVLQSAAWILAGILFLFPKTVSILCAFRLVAICEKIFICYAGAPHVVRGGGQSWRLNYLIHSEFTESRTPWFDRLTTCFWLRQKWGTLYDGGPPGS